MSGRQSGPLAKALRDIGLCIGFYTLLPVRMMGHSEAGDSDSDSHNSDSTAAPDLARDFAAPDFSSAQWAAPVAGAIVGCLAGGAFALAQYGGLAPFVCAALALATSVLVTGALHEDGFADVADGFGGGRTVERKLAIMKDSCIGTYGTLALITGFTVRLTALAALGGHVSPAAVAIALIAAHSASRALLPVFMRLLPPARPTGLAAGFGRIANHTMIVALVLGAAALLACGVWTALVAAVLLGVWVAVLRFLAQAQIGGLTGDVLGTLQQGGEIIVLIVASAVLTGQ